MMNFPTWPCNFPQKAEESNKDKLANDKLAKKLSKKISNTEKTINDNLIKDLTEFDMYKTIEDIALDPKAQTKFLKSLDSYLNDLSQKINLQKLAKGSFVLKFDLDDSYSQDGNIPFPKEPF
jgi:hypothetical protein